MRIRAPLHWDENNVRHLWHAHQVTTDEVEEAIFGIEGEDPTYRVRRDGDVYMVFGETGGGRLLKMVGKTLLSGHFRVFGAIDMNDREKRTFREG